MNSQPPAELKTHFDKMMESNARAEDAADRMITIAEELHLTIEEFEVAVDKVKIKAHVVG